MFVCFFWHMNTILLIFSSVKNIIFVVNLNTFLVLLFQKRHHVLKTVHPSPLSAHRGFFGCQHFSKANTYLKSVGKKPIDWTKLWSHWEWKTLRLDKTVKLKGCPAAFYYVYCPFRSGPIFHFKHLKWFHIQHLCMIVNLLLYCWKTKLVFDFESTV